MSGNSPPTVLLVDDEEMLLETYRLWLADEYDVRTAGDGRGALQEMDDAVDVVLLDRRMPDMSGDEVLAAIREEGYDCKVAMVTAVDPDVDIVEMPFDAYLTKPVQKTDLVDVIDRLDVVARQASVSQELFAVTEKRATLESEFNRSRLARSEEYTDLVERHESLSAEARETIQGMDHEGFEASFRDLGDGLDGSGND